MQINIINFQINLFFQCTNIGLQDVKLGEVLMEKCCYRTGIIGPYYLLNLLQGCSCSDAKPVRTGILTDVSS